jgi:hypothetical protein
VLTTPSASIQIGSYGQLLGSVAQVVKSPWYTPPDVVQAPGGLGGFLTAVVVQGGVLLLRLAVVSCPPRT